MRYLPLTLPNPEENLALDEALLNAASSDQSDTLRVWESPTPVVVVGRASRVEEEVDTAACQRRGVPVLRRVSGGATVVWGPGCLMYAVTLGLGDNPEPLGVDAYHRKVLTPLATALKKLEPTIHVAGTSDLAYRPSGTNPAIKFSGNSLRVTRNRLLYHGTLLYDFDLPLVSQLLRTPPRQPEYRNGRPHDAFIGNLPTDRESLLQAVAGAWPINDTSETLSSNESAAVAELVKSRYALDSWNLSR